MKEDLLETIESIAKPLAEQLSLDLVDLHLNRRGQSIVVDVIADRPQGGITIDECTKLNRVLSEQLEEEDIIEDEYIVEVSSPGIDRPLMNQKDFKRVIGRNVRFHLLEKVLGKVEYQGVVKDVQEENVKITTKKEEVQILYSQISKAIQII